MAKKLLVAPFLLMGVGLYIWDKSMLLQALDRFFRWLSMNPEVIYLLGAFIVTFALLSWGFRRHVDLEI